MLVLLIWEIWGEGQGNEGAVLIPKEINRNKVQLDSANGSNDLQSPCPKLVKSIDQRQVLLSGCITLSADYILLPGLDSLSLNSGHRLSIPLKIFLSF